MSFALDHVERSVAHRPKIGGEVKAIVDKEGTEETRAGFNGSDTARRDHGAGVW